ncbi:MAG TPA: hypothetical protein VMN60_09430 [Longimicrobiales bacterium]|nr:hypothetical protein [Longimicrobiales bacterium]
MDREDTPDVDADALRARFEQIEGIERVFVDAARREAFLVVRGDVDPVHAEQAAHAVAADDSLRIFSLFRPEHRDRQRVRFVSVDSATLPDKQIRFTTTLEWSGRLYAGSATGEKGDTIELRTVASSALAAVSEIVSNEIALRLAAVKLVRAFDAEMVVVSLYRPDATPHNLVGAVVAGDDPRRAAATAVLNSLNRLLGNYLALP